MQDQQWFWLGSEEDSPTHLALLPRSKSLERGARGIPTFLKVKNQNRAKKNKDKEVQKRQQASLCRQNYIAERFGLAASHPCRCAHHKNQSSSSTFNPGFSVCSGNALHQGQPYADK